MISNEDMPADEFAHVARQTLRPVDITRTLSDAQAALVRYLGKPCEATASAAKKANVRPGTYQALKRSGHIEETEAFPFHGLTDLGRVWLKQDAERQAREAREAAYALQEANHLLADIRQRVRAALAVHPAELSADHRALVQFVDELDRRLSAARDGSHLPADWRNWG